MKKSKNEHKIIKLNDTFSLTKRNFSDIIFNISKNNSLNLLESIAFFCDKYDIEEKKIAKVLSDKLKLEIQFECENLHLIKKNGRIL